MMGLLSNIRNKLLSFNHIKTILKWSTIFLVTAYLFSILAFSLTNVFLCYITIILLVCDVSLYIFLYIPKELLRLRNFVLIGFLISAFIGTALYSHRWREYLTLVLMAIGFLAILSAFVIVENRKLVFFSIIFAFFVFALYFLFYFRNEILNYKSYSYDEFRLGPPIENPNTIGNFMTIAIAITVYVFLFFDGKIRFLLIVPLVLFFFIGFTTGSRTFFILSIISVFLSIFFRFRMRWWITLIVLAVLIACLYVTINFVPIFSSIKYRLDETYKMLSSDGVSSGSTLERIEWQKYGLYLASKRIFFGYGESGFAAASGVNTYTHGNFSEVLCDFGVVGFCLFYLVLLLPFAYCIFKKKDNNKFFVFIITIILIVNGFLSVFYYDKSTYILFALMYYIISDQETLFYEKKN